jgi:prepilin-type N-terminal cleavage/methylation domain-containing protein
MTDRKGFTLIELLVAMVIASVVLTAIYSVYRAQTRQHRVQQMVVQMQQNMRAAMYLLEREIRMAGYSRFNPPAPAGFVANFAGYGSPHDASGAATDASNVAFTVDNDDDGAISAATSFEIIAFRLDGANNRLERWDAVSGQWQVAAEQITALSFTYHREDGSALAFPIDPGDLPDIRSVEVALQATSGDRTMNLTNRIKCRNTGF